MPLESLDNIIAPARFRLDGVVVTIYEALKSKIVSGKTWYHVTVDFTWRGNKSRRFSIDCRDVNDLIKKLLVEISKFKWFVLVGVNP